MFPLSTKLGGMTIAMPDVCKTPAPPGPPVPMPYPCTVSLALANPATCALKVKVSGGPALSVRSVVTMTSGMEAGVAGGVVSGMIKGPARFTMGSSKVMIEGAPAVYLTCPMDANGANANTKGVQSVPSQVKVLVTG